MLRPTLAAIAVVTLAGCSTAVANVPAVETPDAGAPEAVPDDTAASADPGTDPTTSSDATDTTTTEDAATAPETVPADSSAPETSAVESSPAPVDAMATGSEAPAPVTPPDPPITAVWQEDGPETQRAQEHLLSLGFWLAEANGDYGQTTTQAVMAFQKYYGLAADGKLGPQTAEAMSTVTERPTGRSTGGTLVEVDKSKQLLFLVRDGVTEWVLNTSTGSEVPYREPDQNTPGAFIEDESITRPGVFAVDRERPEGWWEGDLGEIYRPKYFDGGIALHGSYNIPPYPASHGCVRLSIQAMDWIWEQDLVPMGTTVWVHGEIPDRDA